MRENLAGPGGGPDFVSNDLTRYYKDIANRGAGAFPTGGGNPPPTGVSPTKAYLPKKEKKARLTLAQARN